MRISDWSSDVCSSDLISFARSLVLSDPGRAHARLERAGFAAISGLGRHSQTDRLPHRPRRYPDVGASDEGRSGRLSYQAGSRSDLAGRSEEHTSELQSLMRISYAVFCLKKKTQNTL